MRSRQRALLVVLLVLLVLLACGLGAFYVWIGQPPATTAKVDVEGLTHERSIYSPLSATALKFSKPSRMGVDPDGNLVVCDPEVKAVLRVSQDGRILGKLNPKKAFVVPAGVGVWADGTTWVADWPSSQIVVFDSAGTETGRIDYATPLSINIYADRAYVTSSGSVGVFNKTGSLLTTYGGGRGSAPGQVDMPHGVVPEGKDLVIGDSLNSRVVRLSAGNKVVWSVGFREKGMTKAPEGPYNLPTDLVQGEKGFIFVIDAFTSQISIADPKTGKVVRQVGEMGSQDGQFMYPEGLAYLGGDRYAVADKYNARIQIVRIPLPGATANTSPLSLPAKVGPGDVGVLLLWCAVPLGVLLLAVLVFLALRRRADSSSDEADGHAVTQDTEGEIDSD